MDTKDIVNELKAIPKEERWGVILTDTKNNLGIRTSTALLTILEKEYKKYRDNCYYSGDAFNAQYTPYNFGEWVDNNLPKAPIDEEHPNAKKL